MKWEYMTVMFETKGLWTGTLDGQAFTDRLNRLGEEGWELVSVFETRAVEVSIRHVVAVMKRSLR